MKHYPAQVWLRSQCAEPFSEIAGTQPQPRLGLWLSAVRDAYVTLLPMTIVGALALSLSELPALLAQLRQTPSPAPQTAQLLKLFFHATFGVMGLLCSMAIAARTTRLLQQGHLRNRHSVVTVSLLAGAAFLVCVLPFGTPDFQVLGYASVFQSIVVGVGVAEAMHGLARRTQDWSERNLLEAGVSLGYALQMSLFALLLLAGVALLRLGCGLLVDALGLQLQTWTQAWAGRHDFSALWLNPLFVLLNQLLWTVGINGGQLLLHLADQGSALMAPNGVLYSAHQASLMFLNAYAHLGGAGATWGLILCCLLRGRDPVLRRLACYSLLPALLNVNEMLLFGIPLVLNRSLLLPFIGAPLVACLVSSAAVHGQWLPLQGQAVAWSTPVLLSGYLSSGGWQGVLLQLLVVGLCALIYAPFVRHLESARALSLSRHFHAALQALGDAPPGGRSEALQRNDAVGVVARALQSDFRADLGTPRVSLAYQPQLDSRGRLVGAEALLRWTHAVHGPISPAVIVNIAEESCLIHDLGRWTLNQAASDVRRWRDLGYGGFHVGVNMSPLQLEDPGWSRSVAQALQAHGLRAGDLELEVTEGRALGLSAQTDRSLTELSGLGLLLSMDDFGMGSTSLLYMHRFRLHTIKLDGNLTRDVCASTVDRDIISCVCRLGHSQGVQVVAEYVETLEQWRALKALGCDRFQGWYFSRALPAAEFQDYLAQRRAGLG